MYHFTHISSQPRLTHLASLETSGTPPEFQLKMCVFEQCLAAQQEFVMFGPQVPLLSELSFPHNDSSLRSSQSRAVKVNTLIKGMLAPHVAVWSISVLLNERGLG